MAPRARFELATLRLTAECSAVELPGNSSSMNKLSVALKPILGPIKLPLWEMQVTCVVSAFDNIPRLNPSPTFSAGIFIRQDLSRRGPSRIYGGCQAIRIRSDASPEDTGTHGSFYESSWSPTGPQMLLPQALPVNKSERLRDHQSSE